MCIIEICEKTLIPKGKYWARYFDCRAVSTVSKTLRKGDVFTKVFHYALFRNGADGYMVKRKTRNIPETEQLWEDVCEITAYKEVALCGAV